MSNIDKWHIQLLSVAEQEELYTRPEFSPAERDHFFVIDEAVKVILDQYELTKAKIHFLLLNGYFQAKHLFFKFTFEQAKEDIAYIVRKYFPEKENAFALQDNIWKEHYRRQKEAILELHEYTEWKPRLKQKISDQILWLLRRHPKGNDTLRELLVFFTEEKITLPSYRTLQDLFTDAFSLERERLNQVLLTIPKHLQNRLEVLIENDDGFTELNTIKLDQKDFKYTAIQSEVKKSKLLSEIYPLAKNLLPSLELSTNAIRYYASLAEHYTASRIRKLSQPQQWLHVLCFVFHRYQTIMENLITSFALHTKSVMDDGKVFADEQEERYRKSITLDLPQLGKFLKWYSSYTIAPGESLQDFYQAGTDILSKEKQHKLSKYLAGIRFDKEAATWSYYEESAKRIAMYLRPILMTVDFQFHKPNSDLMQWIEFLRDYFSKSKSIKHFLLPESLLEKLSEKIRHRIKPEQSSQGISAARFEFFVYKKMFHAIDRGWLFCNESISYGNLDDDLVPDEYVDQAEELCQQYGYPKIATYCDEHLEDKLADLESAWQTTIDNIQSGENASFEIDTDDEGLVSWKLTYQAEPVVENQFFNQVPKIDIADLLKLMGDIIRLWPVFTHQKHRYIKCQQPDPLLLIGCLLSVAFGFGAKHMATISNLSYNNMRDVDNDFMHVENFCQVNDEVSNFIYHLPVAKVYNLVEGVLIGDADGQKFETRSHTVQSRHSSKYFGTYKGISVYTLTVNHIPVNAKNIGPNEYEGHHLFDLLYNNNSDIALDKVTGDQHSINQINYVVLDAINIAFIPSIKDIRAASEKLYSVHDPKQYSGVIKPCKKINKKLIQSEKRGIIRVLLSLIMQENTQAVIIKKLSSHKRYSRLRAALWEYNKIFQSTHILNLINDAKLRKVIKSARNRTEAYHQLQRTIRKVHNGVFSGRKIVSNAISMHASRLVANCIIAYNAMLLNQVYLRLIEKVGKTKADEMMRRVSPVAWQHIIFTGRYSFTDKAFIEALDQLIDILEDRVSENLAKQSN